MSTYVIIRGDDRKEFKDEQKFRDTVELLEEGGVDFETETRDAKPDGGDWQPGDDGTPAEVDVYDGKQSVAMTGENVGETPTDAVEADSADDLPERSVADDQVPDDPNLTDDPFAWMPGDFVDTIDGTPTINRRGYAALGRKFGISAPDITIHVGPEETDHTYARVEATVVDDDGREYVNHGSASVKRGDDVTLLLELAVTRARKRALAGATGVGLIAVEELKNEL